MRILHIITGLGTGGAEATLFKFIQSAENDSHSVISLLGRGWYASEFEKLGVPVFAIQMSRRSINLAKIIRIWCIVRSIKPDIIKTWMYHSNLIGGIIGKTLRIPVVWGIHNSALSSSRSRIQTRMIDKMCSIISNSVPDKIVACANCSRDVHVKNGYNASKIQVIQNGYDTAKFAPNSSAREILREQWGVNKSTFVIGMVARYDSEKDHSTVIKSIRSLIDAGHDLKLVLVGSNIKGDNRVIVNELRDNNMESHTLLLGERRDIADIMNAIDIHVLCSFSEAFPNVLCEAMACGTPCVGTNVGDVEDIIGGTGFIVPVQDVSSMVNAIGDAQAQSRNSMQWNNRKIECRDRIIEMFHINIMLSKYHNCLREVASIKN